MRMLKLLLLLYASGFELLFIGMDVNEDFPKIVGAIVLMIATVVNMLNILQIV